MDEQGFDVVKSILDGDSAIEKDVSKELAKAAASAGSANATGGNRKRMSPAARRRRFVASGQKYEEDGN